MSLEMIGLKTGEGKSTLAIKNACESALKGMSTLLISTEMTYPSIKRRCLELLNGEDITKIPLYFTTNMDDTTYDFIADNIAENNIKYVVVDHIPASKNNQENYDNYIKMLSQLIEDYGVDVLAFYQMAIGE